LRIAPCIAASGSSGGGISPTSIIAHHRTSRFLVLHSAQPVQNMPTGLRFTASLCKAAKDTRLLLIEVDSSITGVRAV
jgi:hypothetical protein